MAMVAKAHAGWRGCGFRVCNLVWKIRSILRIQRILLSSAIAPCCSILEKAEVRSQCASDTVEVLKIDAP